MLDKNSREFAYFKVPVFVSDFAIHATVLWFAIHYVGKDMHDYLLEGDYGLFGLLLLAFSSSIGIFKIRLHERKIKIIRVVWRALMQTAVTYILFTALLAMVYKATPRSMVLAELFITLPIIAIWHYIVNRLVRLLRQMGRNRRTVIIIGADEIASRLYNELREGQALNGYDVKGYFSSLEESRMPEDVCKLGSVDDFHTWIQNHDVDEIYCSLPPASCEEQVDKIIHVCNDRFIEFYYVPTMDGYPHRHMLISNIGKVSVIRLRDEPMNTLRCHLFKRTIDILISGLFLCTIYPFVCLFVWLGDIITGSRGKLYFRQARTGYNGQDFMVYKFRSMKENDDADTLQATKDDPRKTPFGDFLRRTSIDELPQFINVFLGDMSIIGPRPHMVFHTEMYSALIGDYMVRHLAKPGITGWAQISGCRGETKTVEEMKDRVEHDIWYIENWTPLLDIEIFFKTIWQVLPGHDKQAY